jgi:hypothetical protein
MPRIMAGSPAPPPSATARRVADDMEGFMIRLRSIAL